MTITAIQKAKRDAYRCFPRRDAVEAVMDHLGAQGRVDWQLAPLMAERLRHVYPKIAETVYPEYLAAEGGVLPIDSSASPADETWRKYTMDQQGVCAWIDDDGDFAPSNSITLRQDDGRFANFGHMWDVTIFDLERAAKAQLQLQTLKGKMSKRAHQVWKNWHWLFGDSPHEMEGLCTHPNIHVLLAAFDSATGNTSRLWANKTDADIFRDIKRVIDLVPTYTIRAHFIAKVFLPLNLVQECMGRFLAGTDSGVVTLWDRIVKAFSGDPVTGQGKVEFRILNECQGTLRRHPVSGTDTSGITGDFILACPPDDVEMNAFMSARPFSQEAPQQVKLKIQTLTHEKIGGARIQTPKAFVRMDFGLT